MDRKRSVAVIKAELRVVFGLQQMEAWMSAAALKSVAPGETIDVFEELKKFVCIATAGTDTVGRVAACLLVSRLPANIHETVLLQCGKDMAPTVVVVCTKQLMTSVSLVIPACSATTPNVGP